MPRNIKFEIFELAFSKKLKTNLKEFYFLDLESEKKGEWNFKDFKDKNLFYNRKSLKKNKLII